MRETDLQYAENILYQDYGLTLPTLERVLSSVRGGSIDGGDLYFQHTQQEYYFLEDSLIKNADYSVEQGIGLRAWMGEQTGLSYTQDFREDLLIKAAKAARSIAQKDTQGKLLQGLSLSPGFNPSYYAAQSPFAGVSPEEKLSLLRLLDQQARAADRRVEQVMVQLSASYDTILVMTLDGRLAADRRPLIRVNVQVVVADGNKRESASVGGGGRYDFATLQRYCTEQAFAQEAVRMALVNLSAQPAPAGQMPVVLGPGWPGVLLHEAVGHGLEGDFNRKGSSVYSGRIGEAVASPLCTVVDDGTLADRRGSLNIDDEGHPTQRNVLIEKGILKGYLQDSLNARLMGVAPTGNGRRESYASRVLPRMTNTFLCAGPHDPQEIISSVQDGIYAVHFSGGQVDITTGNFVFSSSEAYKIEKGKITTPIKGATLIGNGPQIMHRISMVGHDLALDTGVGICGKEGQSVPVGVGQPTVLIDQLTVGGTEHVS